MAALPPKGQAISRGELQRHETISITADGRRLTQKKKKS
jgi:hypothetical protein